MKKAFLWFKNYYGDVSSIVCFILIFATFLLSDEDAEKYAKYVFSYCLTQEFVVFLISLALFSRRDKHPLRRASHLTQAIAMLFDCLVIGFGSMMPNSLAWILDILAIESSFVAAVLLTPRYNSR